MQRRWIVYSAVNIVHFSAAITMFLLHHDPARAQAAEGWTWPLSGPAAVDRPFDAPDSEWGAGHRGVDLRGQAGQPVLAAGAGTVAYSGLLAGRGVVVVKHADGLRTTYEPVVDGPSVGTAVDTGQRIGRLAHGHASCRPRTDCLHWGLLRGEQYLDPLRLVLGGQVRLLPLDPPRGAASQTRRESYQVTSRPAPDPLASATPVERPPRALEQFAYVVINLTTVAALGYGLFVGVRRGARLVRAVRSRLA